MPDQPRQPSTGQLWLVPEQGQERQERIATVAIRVRTHRLYTYRVPPNFVHQVTMGTMVRVPYGAAGRLVDGWCVGVADAPWRNTRKAIAEVVPSDAILTPALIELGLWIAEYYVAPPGRTLELLIPTPVRDARMRNVAYVRRSGAEAPASLTHKRRAVLDALAAEPMRRSALLSASGATADTLRGLVRLGLIETFKQREAIPFEAEDSASAAAPSPIMASIESQLEDQFTLTVDQQGALSAINSAGGNSSRFRAFLLFGVPGSGKTEVYVRAIREAIAAGRQAIVLIPEIALATQVVQRMARRFARVIELHSRLSPGGRARALRAIAAGDADVVIGTRTAVFAPLRRLGLIVVDEEQEGSFKNLAGPFFHARDVAIKRAQIENVPVVLGSATPSLEMWHNAQARPHFERLVLRERVPGAQLPTARAIDVSRNELGQTTRIVSPELIAATREAVARGDQVVLLHNRRGYAVHLRCKSCGLVVRCERCGAHMILHTLRPRRTAGSEAESSLKCHRCTARAHVPPNCLDSTCGGALERTGLAIQRLEEELRDALPAVRLLRMDSDEVHRREQYAEALARFEHREADVLIGTQMVAKGLDFPGVRLVGVVEADSMLQFPDFRAAERAFQLLMQVVGRAGRREGESLALIQSAEVAAPAIRFALKLDYVGFAREELLSREALGYPPFGRLTRIVCLDARPAAARSAAQIVARELRRLAGGINADIRVFDAEPCIVPRLRDLLRWQVLVRAPRGGSMQALLHRAESARIFQQKVKRLTIDVDALDLV